MSNISVNTTELLQLLDITPADQNLMLVGDHGIGRRLSLCPLTGSPLTESL